ncbi:hypothetical protein ACOMHN_050011 [Nucella lapillus]
MDTLLPKEDSHSSHDDLWCIVSESSALPLCVACLVERLEQQSLIKVQNHFNLSLLANTIKENEEALRAFREHPLVCQHVLDIVAERLLVRLLEMYTNAEADEASSCSLLFLLTRFSDQLDILPAVSPSVLPLVEQCMLRSLTSAQPEDVHINAVALLKCLLKADCCLRHDSDKWTELFLGLKRLFVSKKQTLVIAATQCLGLIASIPRHAHVLRLVLDTDLPVTKGVHHHAVQVVLPAVTAATTLFQDVKVCRQQLSEDRRSTVKAALGQLIRVTKAAESSSGVAVVANLPVTAPHLLAALLSLLMAAVTCAVKVLTSASSVVENVFQGLLREDCAHCQGLPDYLRSGLRHLSLERTLVQLAMSEHSVDHWATPHPRVFTWVFAAPQRAQDLGASLNLMASSSEEICVLLRKLFVTLITSNVERSEEQSRQLIRSLYEEVMSKFQSLFMLSVQPRLVHCIGGSDGEDSELLYNGLATLDCLSNITDEEQDQLVVPILLQNTSFMQQLEKSLHRDDQQLASVALSVVAWISSSSSSCQTEHPITVSTEFIIDIVTQSGSKQAVAALKILHLSLDLSSPLLPSPLTFHASHTYHNHDGALYTAHEMRLLFTYVQQYICLENEEIQFYAIKCYLELLNQSKLFDNALGDQLLHDPWNPQLLHCVLTNTATAGLQLHTTDFIHRARRDCQDDDLVEQATLKLEALENSLSFSQNTLVSTT